MTLHWQEQYKRIDAHVLETTVLPYRHHGPARQRIQWEQTPYHRATNRPTTGPEQIPPLQRQDAFQQATQVIDLQSDNAPKEQTPVLAAVYATSATDDAMHQVYPPLTSADTITDRNQLPDHRFKSTRECSNWTSCWHANDGHHYHRNASFH
jgi:hypothetical protein